MVHSDRWSLLFYGCLYLMISCVSCGYEHKCSSDVYSKGPSGTLCGRALADAVSAVCGGTEYINMSGGRKKRDTYTDLKRYQKRGKIRRIGNLESAMKDSSSLRKLMLDKRNAVSYIKKRDLIDEKGIVCECCYNNCELIELYEYCSYSSGL